MPGREHPGAGEDRGRSADGTRLPVRVVRDLHGDMCVRLTERGGRTTAVVTGEVDHTCAPTLERALLGSLGQSRGGLLLDLGGVSFCDCAGLNALLRVRRRATRRGCELTVVAPGPAVERLLVLTGTRVLLLGPAVTGDGRAEIPGPARALGPVPGSAPDRPPDRRRGAARHRPRHPRRTPRVTPAGPAAPGPSASLQAQHLPQHPRELPFGIR